MIRLRVSIQRLNIRTNNNNLPQITTKATQTTAEATYTRSQDEGTRRYGRRYTKVHEGTRRYTKVHEGTVHFLCIIKGDTPDLRNTLPSVRCSCMHARWVAAGSAVVL